MTDSELDLARSLLTKGREGTLPRHLAEHLRCSHADPIDVLGALLAALLVKGTIPATDIARIVARASQHSPAAPTAAAPRADRPVDAS